MILMKKKLNIYPLMLGKVKDASQYFCPKLYEMFKKEMKA